MTARLSLAALVILLAAPAAALAGPGQESVFEDETVLLSKGSDVQASSLDEMRALGADVIRTLVIWNGIAPSPRSKKRPKGFDASDPAAYPHKLWDRYDDLVRGAQARGLSILFSPTAPMPRWASGCSGSANKVRTCKPNIRAYGAFVQALGTRYSGTYPDENQGQGLLPRVDRWSLWNEPNQPGWLSPQYVARGGRKVPYAADRYRSLAAIGIRGLQRSGHGSDQILLGETAPIGRTSGTLANRPIPPVDFIRRTLCLSGSGHRMRDRASGCRHAKRFAVSGFAHHPYTRGGSQPPLSRPLPGEITIAVASRLKKLLSQGARAGMVPRNLPIWYTEFGYQSNPPDRIFGVPLPQQATYINQSDWIAYQDKRVRSVAQYKLIDDPIDANFQTGLRYFARGQTAKPAYDAYRLPIWVVRKKASVLVYGQVRPAADDAVESVEIQHRPASGGGFAAVATVVVSSHKGDFTQQVPGPADGDWRLRWSPSTGGAPLFSREAAAAKR